MVQGKGSTTGILTVEDIQPLEEGDGRENEGVLVVPHASETLYRARRG